MGIKYSVIMPCYNAEAHIESTLDKFQNVIHDRDDVELVIVNDGSSDKTLELINQNFTPYLKLITIDNQGVSNARNVGMDAAVGEYIMFLDSDDYYERSIFESLDLNLSNAEVLLFGYQTVLNDGDVRRKYSYSDLNCIDSFQVLSFLFEKKIPVHICATVIRREVIESNNLLFNVDVHHCEDLEFIIKALASVSLITVSSNILYNYVDQPNSAVNQVVDSKQLTKFHVFEVSLPSFIPVRSYAYYDYYVLSVYLLLMLKVLKQGVTNDSIVREVNRLFKQKVSKDIVYPMGLTPLKIRTLVIIFKLISFIKIFTFTKKIRDLHAFKRTLKK
ncbi:glycosyltransferase [Scandinavium sp.]|uniref:glycosyltransferase family 2 protein n=1 Tax=Scandinavium sp. TaxID=2830653 RepID=UPI00289D9672|nr:glycosyltransferase [Scandinavium sp.]